MNHRRILDLVLLLSLSATLAGQDEIVVAKPADAVPLARKAVQDHLWTSYRALPSSEPWTGPEPFRFPVGFAIKGFCEAGDWLWEVRHLEGGYALGFICWVNARTGVVRIVVLADDHRAVVDGEPLQNLEIPSAIRDPWVEAALGSATAAAIQVPDGPAAILRAESAVAQAYRDQGVTASATETCELAQEEPFRAGFALPGFNRVGDWLWEIRIMDHGRIITGIVWVQAISGATRVVALGASAEPQLPTPIDWQGFKALHAPVPRSASNARVLP